MSTRTRQARRPAQARPAAAASVAPIWRAQAGRLLAPLLVVLAGVGAYAYSFSVPFQFDDVPGIPKNPAVTRGLPLGELLSSQAPAFSTTLRVSYLLNRWLSPGRDGFDVRGFHAMNLAIHILAALTLYGLVRRTLLRPLLRGRLGEASRPLALVIALAWMLHPLQTESVTYLVQRKESLMGLFYLLTLYCLLRAEGASSPRRRGGWYALTVLACLLAMESKQVAATAPLVALLYDRTFLSGSFRAALRRRWVLYLLLCLTWVPLGIGSHARLAAEGLGTVAISRWGYARTQAGVVLHYLRLCIWPAGLCLDYSWPIAQGFWQIGPPLAAIGVLLALTGWGLWGKGSGASQSQPQLSARRGFGFLGAWFFLILAPTSSVIVITEVAFEHRLYLPLAGVVAAVVVGGYLLWRRAGARLSEPARRHAGLAAGTGATLLVVGVLGGLTLLRNHDYRSALALWRDVVHKRPDNARAHMSLALELADPRESLAELDQAIELDPKYVSAHANRSRPLLTMGRPDEALAACNTAISLVEGSPDSSEICDGYCLAYINRGGVYFQQALAATDPAQRSELLRRGVEDETRAIQMRPMWPLSYSNRGEARRRLGQLQEALEDLNTAIALDPAYADAYCNRGIVRRQLRQPQAALADFDLAIRYDPAMAVAYFNRAVARLQLGQVPQAHQDLGQYQRLGGDPELIRRLEQAATQPRQDLLP